MQKQSYSQKKKKILTAALNQFLKDKVFPEYKSFRLQFEHEWSLLDELVEEKFFNSNHQYSHKQYVLRLKGLSAIGNKKSKEILNASNKLIKTFKKFYRKDHSDNKLWTVEEIVQDSGVKKEMVEMALFFLEDMYFFGGHQSDQKNEYIKLTVGVRERVLTLTTVEDFLAAEYQLTEHVKQKQFRVTLILGAGLGVEYGYPDGPELKELIEKELLESDKKLKDILYWTTAETVDEIAARHPEHANLLRQIVVKILAEREIETKLGRHKNNTYKLMLKQIGLAKSKGHIVNIVTFNYDRSLQWMISKVNQIEPQERKIESTIINPIYGRLAPFQFEAENTYDKMLIEKWGTKPVPTFWVYGGHQCPDDYSEEYWKKRCIAEMITESKLNFIGEVLAKKNEKVEKILNDSDQIFFLGCGYHQANIEVLGFDFKQKYSNKLIAGTGMGLSKVDIESIQQRNQGIDHIEEGCDAFTFLKRKFDISDPSKNSFKKPNTSF